MRHFLAIIIVLVSFDLSAAIDTKESKTTQKPTNLVPGYSAPQPQTQPQTPFPKPASPEAQPSTPLPAIPTQEQLKSRKPHSNLQFHNTAPSPTTSPEPSSYLKTIRERQNKQALQQQPAPNGPASFNFGDQKRPSISRDVPGKWPTDSPTQNPQQLKNHRKVQQNAGRIKY